MRRTPGRSGRALAAWLQRTTPGRILLDPRRRRHAALLSTLLAISVFGFVLLRPRTVRVQADGRDLLVSTHMANDSAVIRSSGVEIRPGDRVTALTSPSGDVLRVDRARSVTLLVDGATYHVRTHAVTIDQLLAEMEVAIGDRDSSVQNGDLVSVNAPVDPPRLFASRSLTTASPARENTIEVRRAVPFSIDEAGRLALSTSSRQTVAEALREAGVIVGPGDAVAPAPTAELVANVRIDVRHAKALTVTLPHDHRVLYTLDETVGEALTSAGIAVPTGTFTDPSPDVRVVNGMSVRVVQLSASSDLEREFIESGTEYRVDSGLRPGETRTVLGHDGARVRKYDVAYVNGQEAGRTLIDEYYDPEPVDTVIYYAAPRSGGEQPPPPGARRVLRVYATWYDPASSGRAPSDPAYGHTATGVVVTYGIVAVDPNVIPLGTKMYIPGYGYAEAADTGGAVKGYVIDLGFPDGVQVDWQSKWVDITILS